MVVPLVLALALALALLLGRVAVVLSAKLTTHGWKAAGAACAEVLRHGAAEVGHPASVEAGAGDEARVVEALGCVDGYV